MVGHIRSLLPLNTQAGLLQRQKAQESPPKAWQAGETALSREHGAPQSPGWRDVRAVEVQAHPGQEERPAGGSWIPGSACPSPFLLLIPHPTPG